MKILHGKPIHDTVTEALELYFSQKPDPTLVEG